MIKLEAPLFGQWSIEALLPSKLLFVNALSKQSQFYFGARGNAATYVLQQQDDLIANAFTGSHYRRLSINGVAGYERQLTPWLGLSLEMGVNVPYRAGIYDAENNQVQLHILDAKWFGTSPNHFGQYILYLKRVWIPKPL